MNSVNKTQPHKVYNAINKVQSEILYNFMSQNPDIAKGFHYAFTKERYVKCWRNLEKALNKSGPPRKSMCEWKKVWSDQRRYVTKKAKNKGLAALSPLEDIIFTMLQNFNKYLDQGSEEPIANKKQSAAIVKDCDKRQAELPLLKAIEAPAKRIKLEVEENNTVEYGNNLYNITVLNEAEMSDDEPDEFGQEQVMVKHPPPELDMESEAADNCEESSREVLPNSLSPEIEDQSDVNDLQQQSTTNSKELPPSAAYRESSSSRGRVSNPYEKIYNCLERLCDLKTEELVELKRHNREMEKFRKIELKCTLQANPTIQEYRTKKSHLNHRK
uniref:Regulatory protein zeste n=1 Tax=Glossina pallidipes TaxID=7398 RepID=A0A1A9Z6T7_GLOPL